MLHRKNSVEETHYEILSAKEDSSYEEIRTSYRSAVLQYHPDKLQCINQTCDSQNESGDRFLKIQKAWEILGDARSRAVYDSQLRALRQDTGIAEDVNLEDMMIEDSGEFLEFYYQCRCGDYFSIDSSDFGKMGYILSRKESKVLSFETADALPGSIILPCGSCSLQIRLSINTDIKVTADDHL